LYFSGKYSVKVLIPVNGFFISCAIPAARVPTAYDAMDRAKSILFPSGKKVDFTFNNAGLLENIPGFINGIKYNAIRQPEELIYMNPITSRFDYYPDNLRLKTIISGSLQYLSYEYDNAGNVLKIIDNSHSLVKNYLYDDLDRLISGDGNVYEYNSIGNLIKNNGIVQGYSSARKHALTYDGLNNYSYDNCGNMISGAGRSIAYDAENRPIQITKNGVVTEFVYDGDGKRVKKRATENAMVTSTVYVEGLYEKETVEELN
jgi:YD repeat-containing protein